MKQLLFVCLLLTAAAAQTFGSQSVDLLLVAADDATLAPVLARLENSRTETHAAWTLWTGKLGEKSAVIARSEGDPLNAVAATTLALRSYSPRLIFVFGTARPHDLALQAGDVIISNGFAAFDGIISPPVELGHGTHPLDWEKLPHPLMTAGEKEVPTELFPADAHAREIALSLSRADRRVVEGVLGSASQINREADRIAYVRSQWRTSTEDGESAHIAGCAALFGIPVVGARVVNGTPAAAADFALEFLSHWK